ncbi:hypothetical protein RGI145_23920 (plasmid) [Roseomonas gilardii]|jgi:hypothetical protein|uniref:Uncharacterized protein n=1 Tax=Roseomonas gilardii TaxID=257708 RepID=A0A1L7ANV7_9PROT|nr:hypothetical protein [Roseomonas gilardii]APT60394.1 hypothetical protein RGI145_23920 [Roseomonas gilardii]
MSKPALTKVNRAPVLTLWATVVAERLVHPPDTALSLAKAAADGTARAKARRLGIDEESDQAKDRVADPAPGCFDGSLVGLAQQGLELGEDLIIPVSRYGSTELRPARAGLDMREGYAVDAIPRIPGPPARPAPEEGWPRIA